MGKHAEKADVAKYTAHTFFWITRVISGCIEESRNKNYTAGFAYTSTIVYYLLEFSGQYIKKTNLAVIHVAKQIEAHFGFTAAIGINCTITNGKYSNVF